MTNSTTPAMIDSHSNTKIEMAVSQTVATHTPSAGPAMNENSVHTESSDRAVRRCSSGTATMRTWRTIENVGTAKSPPSAASPISHQ